MKIRIMGVPDEIDQAVEAIHDVREFDVTDTDGPYANRGTSHLVHVHLEVRLIEREQAAHGCPSCNNVNNIREFRHRVTFECGGCGTVYFK